MKLIAIAFLFAIPAMAQSKIVLTWTSGNTGANALPACPATSPTSCAKGFVLSMDGTVIASESVLGVSATSFTQTPLPVAGNHNYSLIMTGFDAVGNAIQSTPATATVNVPVPVTLNPPAGFKATLQ